MHWAMRQVLLGGGLLSAGGRVAGFLVLLFVSGCDFSTGIDSSDPGPSDDSGVVGQCVPTCDGSACTDDGCGGTCTCKSGFECDDNNVCVASPACTPKCDGTRCINGCGGTCACGDGLVCNAEQDCVPRVDCVDDCEAANYVCGTICGVDCGTCGQDETCVFGKCKSVRSSLAMQLENVQTNAGRRNARLVIEFEPLEDQPLPRMADLRIMLEGGSDLQMEAVSVGPALETADKNLFTDAQTNKPWQLLPEGAVQLLVYSSENVSEIGAGRWLTLEVSFRSSGDARLFLVRHEGLFAPSSADSAVQESAYDLPLTVTP